MGVENYKNAGNTLSAVKERAPYSPLIFTCDLNPSLIAAIKDNFPDSALQIDGFHVMQELNRGINKDLKHYAKVNFNDEIRDLIYLRKILNKIRSAIRSKTPTDLDSVPALKRFDNSHAVSRVCRSVIDRLLYLFKIHEACNFFKNLVRELDILCAIDNSVIKEFCTLIHQILPKRRYTAKGMERVKLELIKKLKKMCLSFRKPLRESLTAFNKAKYLIFKQPERMDGTSKEALDALLKQHPALKEYRNMTVSLGEIYREPYELVDGHQIDALSQKPYYSDKLNTAISTLKKYKSEIISFARIFLEHPELEKACRSNLEWFNKRVKAPFKYSFNRQSTKNIINRLQLQIGGEIRNFLI